MNRFLKVAVVMMLGFGGAAFGAEAAGSENPMRVNSVSDGQQALSQTRAAVYSELERNVRMPTPDAVVADKEVAGRHGRDHAAGQSGALVARN